MGHGAVDGDHQVEAADDLGGVEEIQRAGGLGRQASAEAQQVAGLSRRHRAVAVVEVGGVALGRHHAETSAGAERVGPIGRRRGRAHAQPIGDRTDENPTVGERQLLLAAQIGRRCEAAVLEEACEMPRIAGDRHLRARGPQLRQVAGEHQLVAEPLLAHHHQAATGQGLAAPFRIIGGGIGRRRRLPHRLVQRPGLFVLAQRQQGLRQPPPRDGQVGILFGDHPERRGGLLQPLGLPVEDGQVVEGVARVPERQIAALGGFEVPAACAAVASSKVIVMANTYCAWRLRRNLGLEHSLF